MEAGRTHKRWRLVGLARAVGPLILALVVSVPGVTGQLYAQTPSPSLRVNHLQAKGTHNSFHVASPGALSHINYSHATLREQLEAQGVRQLELDVHWRAREGRFWVWHEPGDEGSTCATFVRCLREVRDWSDEHPEHHLLMIAVELKGTIREAGEDIFANLDNELRSVWPPERRLSPDDLRGDAPSLVDAIATRGWPSLDETRGKAMFVLWNVGQRRAIYSRYGTSLANRAMFVRGLDGHPVGVVMGIDSPFGQKDAILDALSRGFLVRVRADRAVWEALFNWTLRRDLALSLGATWVATDFPAPESGAARGLSYYVEIPEGQPSRCNPITAPAWCRNELIEATPVADPADRCEGTGPGLAKRPPESSSTAGPGGGVPQ